MLLHNLWNLHIALPLNSRVRVSCSLQVGIMFLPVCAGHSGGAAGAVRRLPLEVGEARADRWHQQARDCGLWEEEGFQGNCQPQAHPCIHTEHSLEYMCVCLYLQRLSELYYDIHRSYLKVTEVVNSEKRLFGRYYRVAFYGQVRKRTTLSIVCIY